MIHRTIITPQLIAYTGQNLGEGKLLPMDKLYKRNPQKRREKKKETKTIPSKQTTLTAHNTYMR